MVILSVIYTSMASKHSYLYSHRYIYICYFSSTVYISAKVFLKRKSRFVGSTVVHELSSNSVLVDELTSLVTVNMLTSPF